jgi:hypothetical protein
MSDIRVLFSESTYISGPAECPPHLGDMAYFCNAPEAIKLQRGYLPPVYAEVAEGKYIKTSHWERVGETAVQIIDELGDHAADAAIEEAADAERRSSPIVYDQPLECPMIVLQSHHLGKGIALVATDDLDIVPIVMHESPWPDKATADARIAGALAKRRADRDVALKDINGQIQKRLENVERLLGLRA